jgi:hypothetical protein
MFIKIYRYLWSKWALRVCKIKSAKKALGYSPLDHKDYREYLHDELALAVSKRDHYKKKSLRRIHKNMLTRGTK